MLLPPNFLGLYTPPAWLCFCFCLLMALVAQRSNSYDQNRCGWLVHLTRLYLYNFLMYFMIFFVGFDFSIS
ncbi:hypothetical protein I3760_07G121800 [Carya illinoinensis]|uniref:Uncharacterized protein n=1 Tax=Carya illinoinensis TaxID=32201 RepID=A0A922ELR0_CARIL|nr:hypothetical protein I3760_07G121800 [Carya illinoinensis]KAG6704235.1 hypothetical protein I3842_07G126200 [Carya illinoinensis]